MDKVDILKRVLKSLQSNLNQVDGEIIEIRNICNMNLCDETCLDVKDSLRIVEIDLDRASGGVAEILEKLNQKQGGYGDV